MLPSPKSLSQYIQISQLIHSPDLLDRKGLGCCAIHEAKKELHRYSCFFDKWYYKILTVMNPRDISSSV